MGLLVAMSSWGFWAHGGRLHRGLTAEARDHHLQAAGKLRTLGARALGCGCRGIPSIVAGNLAAYGDVNTPAVVPARPRCVIFS